MYNFDIYRIERLADVRISEQKVGSAQAEDVESTFQYALKFAQALPTAPNISYEICSKFGVLKV
jgi:hypothetical protein